MDSREISLYGLLAQVVLFSELFKGESAATCVLRKIGVAIQSNLGYLGALATQKARTQRLSAPISSFVKTRNSFA